MLRRALTKRTSVLSFATLDKTLFFALDLLKHSQGRRPLRGHCMIKILMVNNISALPFYVVKPSFPAIIQRSAPSAIGGMLQEQTFDAVLMPTALRPHFIREFGNKAGYGISCKGKSLSVLFVSRFDIGYVLANRLPVYIDTESATTKTLFPILCWNDYSILPMITHNIDNASSKVLIGDNALRWLQSDSTWPVVIDLGEWWFKTTGAPFVFARWMMHRRLDHSEIALILEWLAQCISVASGKNGEITLYNKAKDVMQSREEALTYY